MTDRDPTNESERDGAAPPATTTEPSDAARAGDAPAGAPPSGAAPPARPPTLPELASRRPSVTVKLERFEGPLDLLLHLIKRDEIDIYDIPIAHITEQYLAYIELMRALDLDVAGEFLVMAATLMRIKAKMLLPLPQGEEEEEGDPREELVQRLVEYRQFKEAASTLKVREDERRQLFERGMVPGEDEAGPLPLAPATLFDLLDALNRVLARVPEPTIYEVRAQVYEVDDKMDLIRRVVGDGTRVSFFELLSRCHVRAEMIVTFIALLELIKIGVIMAVQPERFGDIQLVARTPEGSEPNASIEPASGD
jgi:segregation and condensation protein A